MKAKIEVYESPLSDKIIHTFSSTEELIKANKTNKWRADQVAVNDCVLMGWDEIYDFI